MNSLPSIPHFSGTIRLDKRKKRDRIKQLKALTELSPVCGHEREGTVGALGKAPDAPLRSGSRRAIRPIPRYRMTRDVPAGMIRVVPCGPRRHPLSRAGLFLFRDCVPGELSKCEALGKALKDAPLNGSRAVPLLVTSKWGRERRSFRTQSLDGKGPALAPPFCLDQL